MCPYIPISRKPTNFLNNVSYANSVQPPSQILHPPSQIHEQWAEDRVVKREKNMDQICKDGYSERRCHSGRLVNAWAGCVICRMRAHPSSVLSPGLKRFLSLQRRATILATGFLEKTLYGSRYRMIGWGLWDGNEPGEKSIGVACNSCEMLGVVRMSSSA
jgi:hypothetical protein